MTASFGSGCALQRVSVVARLNSTCGMPALHLLIWEFVFYIGELAFDGSAVAQRIVVLGCCRIACRAVEWLRGQDLNLLPSRYEPEDGSLPFPTALNPAAAGAAALSASSARAAPAKWIYFCVVDIWLCPSAAISCAA